MKRAAQPQAAPAAAAHRGAGEVRIIGGQYKRQRLKVPPLPGLRPTPDRVRETLFNWLGQDLGGWHCLDAFAGTGALGLECASRGAARVLLVEQHSALVAALQQHCTRLQAHCVQVQRGDGLATLQASAAGAWHLVLLDPPFEQSQLFAPALAGARRALADDGFIYLEAPARAEEAALAAQGLQLQRYLKAGAVHAHLLRRLPNAI